MPWLEITDRGGEAERRLGCTPPAVCAADPTVMALLGSDGTRVELHLRPVVVAAVDRWLPTRAALRTHVLYNAGFRRPYASRTANRSPRSTGWGGLLRIVLALA